MRFGLTRVDSLATLQLLKIKGFQRLVETLKLTSTDRVTRVLKLPKRAIALNVRTDIFDVLDQTNMIAREADFGPALHTDLYIR